MPGNAQLRGVIAAIPTPLLSNGEPDCAKLVDRARHQLENGCDGLNLLGTTGEATSFSTAHRLRVMEGVAEAGLPLGRFMVGTGAAATADAKVLTAAAAQLGFAGALLLPPFYYKGITDDGIARYIEAVANATGAEEIPLYLYNFPALSGVLYTISSVSLLLDRFGSKIAGLKDSSGDMDYAAAVAALSAQLDVFPSNEAVLLRARAGEFAGCISATANLNAPLCAAAFHDGNQAALELASKVRALFADLPLVPGIKAVMARITGDDSWVLLAPPLTQLTAADAATLWQRFDALPDTVRSWPN
jgi:4-hydroxy-tetrahydrodipicolinate synthase